MKKMKKIMENLYKEQSGVSMILVALGIFMLIGFTAFVVDAGSLYFEKSRLQKALDAAVLGGAQMLKVSETKAEGVAIDLAYENGFTVTGSEVTTGENFIEINKTVNKELTFARVLGFTDADVYAYARAETANTLLEGEGIVPVALEKKVYEAGESYIMHFEPGSENNSSVKGNFGFLDIDENKNLKDEIKDGSNLGVYDPDNPEIYVWTKTGFSWGLVQQGFQSRIDQDKNKKDEAGNNYCSSYLTADNTCSRVITVPIIEEGGFDPVTGHSIVKIIGFAAFWIEKIDNTGGDKKVIGRFKNLVRAGTFGPGEDYGIYGVKLVK